jgi:hypothetical protein
MNLTARSKCVGLYLSGMDDKRIRENFNGE